MKKLANISTKNYFLIALFLIICLISYFLPISSAFIAQGFLTYDIHKRKIEHLEGGVVEKVLIKNGQKVVKNQELIILSSLKSGVDRNILRQKLLYLIIKKQVFALERNIESNIERNNKFLANNLTLDKEISLIIQNLTNVERDTFSLMILSAQDYLEASLKKYSNEIKIFDNKKSILITNIKSYQEKLNIIAYQIASQSYLLDKNYANESLILDLRKQQIEIATSLKNLNYELNILENQKQVFRNEYIANIVLKIVDNNLEIITNYQNLKIAEDIFVRTKILAPIDGLVEDLNFTARGEIIQPNQIILELLPVDPDLIVLGKVRQVDIDNIKLFQNVDLYLKNFYEKNIPKISGQIIEISNDIHFDDNLKDYFFDIKIKINPSSQNIISKKNLKSGMVVDIYINQAKRNIFSYILAPIKNSINRSFNDLQ